MDVGWRFRSGVLVIVDFGSCRAGETDFVEAVAAVEIFAVVAIRCQREMKGRRLVGMKQEACARPRTRRFACRIGIGKNRPGREETWEKVVGVVGRSFEMGLGLVRNSCDW